MSGLAARSGAEPSPLKVHARVVQGVPVEFPALAVGVVVYRPTLRPEFIEDSLDLGSVCRGGAIEVNGEIGFPQVEQLGEVGLQGVEAAAGEVEFCEPLDLLQGVEAGDEEEHLEIIRTLGGVFWVVHGVRVRPADSPTSSPLASAFSRRLGASFHPATPTASGVPDLPPCPLEGVGLQPGAPGVISSRTRSRL